MNEITPQERDQLEAARRRCDASPEGPYEVMHFTITDEVQHNHNYWSIRSEDEILMEAPHYHPCNAFAAELFAHARYDLPLALNIIDRLEQRITELHTGVEQKNRKEES